LINIYLKMKFPQKTGSEIKFLHDHLYFIESFYFFKSKMLALEAEYAHPRGIKEERTFWDDFHGGDWIVYNKPLISNDYECPTLEEWMRPSPFETTMDFFIPSQPKVTGKQLFMVVLSLCLAQLTENYF